MRGGVATPAPGLLFAFWARLTIGVGFNPVLGLFGA
jgi:hypothetical protein